MVQNLKFRLLFYADDLKLYLKIVTISDSKLWQEDLHLIFSWFKNNASNFNTENCTVISYTRKTNYIFVDNEIADVVIHCPYSVKETWEGILTRH